MTRHRLNEGKNSTLYRKVNDRPIPLPEPHSAFVKEAGGESPLTNLVNCGAAITTRKKLDLKLREQAKKLGLKPGSARWRAYVLGTRSAMKKRKSQKAKNFPGGVTPGKCTRLVTKVADNRTTGKVG